MLRPRRGLRPVTPSTVASPTSLTPVLASSKPLLRLDLGCGARPQEGFEGVDLLAPAAKHRVDLFKFPWPWADSSIEELRASHFVEHIPAREVEERDLIPVPPEYGGAVNAGHACILQQKGFYESFVGQDMLFAFFDECYRILRPGGLMTVVVPALKTDRAFQDPTHRRFIPAPLFFYLSEAHRKEMGLEHYRARCDFQGTINNSMPSEMALLSPEAQARRFNENWNTMYDYHVTLVSRKPGSS